MILAILNLNVAPMPPAKFGLNLAKTEQHRDSEVLKSFHSDNQDGPMVASLKGFKPYLLPNGK